MVIYTSLACYEHIFDFWLVGFAFGEAVKSIRHCHSVSIAKNHQNPSINWDLQLNFNLSAFWKWEIEFNEWTCGWKSISYSTFKHTTTSFSLSLSLCMSTHLAYQCNRFRLMVRFDWNFASEADLISYFNRISSKIRWNFNWPIFNWWAW